MSLKVTLIKPLLLIVSLFISGCSLFGIRNYEMPEYEVLLQEGDKEIRSYKPYIVAKTTVEGNYDQAQSDAFRILADYIFGNNIKEKEISMTAPVAQKESGESIEMTTPVVQKQVSENISMTAPVTQSGDKKKWVMTFMMPSEYTLKTLPQPKSEKIVLEQVEAKTIAAIRYSWFQNYEKNQKKGLKLIGWIKEKKGFAIQSDPYFAGYDPPWTLPFFRRHEMLVEIRKTAP